jgi:hypothetical protein
MLEFPIFLLNLVNRFKKVQHERDRIQINNIAFEQKAGPVRSGNR